MTLEFNVMLNKKNERPVNLKKNNRTVYEWNKQNKIILIIFPLSIFIF